LDLVSDLNYFSFSHPNPNSNPTLLLKHESLRHNHQFCQCIWYVQYYSVHAHMAWSQKFRKYEISLDTGRVLHCRAHHSIPSVQHQAQYNVVSDYISELWLVEVRDVVLRAYFAVISLLLCINISLCLLTYRLVLRLIHQSIFCGWSWFVIVSLIGDVAFSFMFCCMSFVDCIFWIWILVPFLVMCVFTFS